MISIKQLKEY